jgi:hypothetical protein
LQPACRFIAIFKNSAYQNGIFAIFNSTLLLHIFKGKIPKTGAMADILWYPYGCEIICRKMRQDEDLRKKAFLC